MSMTADEVRSCQEFAKQLVGKTIKTAEVDGYGVWLTFDDGKEFHYNASDGGYSSFGIGDANTDD